MTTAVVLGGGLAGMLAATALAGHADRITVVEADRFPDGPASRRGLPQGHHNHMFMSGGGKALDALLPGTTDRLYAAGARRLRMPTDILTLSAEGWYRRHPGDSYVITCSRDLLDHIVCDQTLADSRIQVSESTTAVGLAGDRARITGVRVERAGEPAQTIDADFVVDATGSRSKTPQWLSELGLPPVPEITVDAGFAYASRRYRAPEKVPPHFPGVLIQAEPGTGRPGRGAALMPNEGGTWIVALIGTRGGQPPTDEAGFMAFARSLRDPVVAQLMDAATPVGDIRAYRGLANRRRCFDQLPMPEGFVVIGDAATTLNPNYATGMSIAAQSTLRLREALRRGGGIRDGLGKAVQAIVAKIADGPWQMAVDTDQWFPHAESNLKRGPEALRRFTARFARTTTENPALSQASFRVAALEAPPSSMMTPSAVLTVLRGPWRPALTRREAIAQYPEFGDILRGDPVTTDRW